MYKQFYIARLFVRVFACVRINMMNNNVRDNNSIICDMCGLNLLIEDFPSHCIICRAVARQPASFFTTRNLFLNILFDADPDIHAQEEEMLNHKIVKRLKNVDHAAPVTKPTIENCCICLESMSNEIRRTACGHEFCCDCIEKWFLENTTCPMCKRDFADDSGYDLIDTQTNEPINSNIEEPTASNPVVRSIIRRLDIIGSILDEIQN